MTVEEIKAAVLALPENDRHDIRWALMESLDTYPIVSIAGADIEQNMADDGYKHERLAEWAKRAAYRVYSKHSGDAEAHYACIEWGTDLVIEYAKEDGVDLQPVEEEEEPIMNPAE